MKQTLSLTLIMLLSCSTLFAKKHNSPHTSVTGSNFTITYGQPSKKGKQVFGDKKDSPIVPYGDVWRAGDDEATEITINKACLFAGRQLGAGTYTLYVIPTATDWTIILNTELKQWGADDYDKIKDKNIIVSPVPVKALSKSVETFTITPSGDGFDMSWDQTTVHVDAKPFGY